MLKESDDPVILGVTFDSKMTFVKHLRSVSIAASQQLGTSTSSKQLGCPGEYVMMDCSLGDAFCVCPASFAVCCTAADTHLKTV